MLEHKVQSDMHIYCDICGEGFRCERGKERHVTDAILINDDDGEPTESYQPPSGPYSIKNPREEVRASTLLMTFPEGRAYWSITPSSSSPSPTASAQSAQSAVISLIRPIVSVNSQTNGETGNTASAPIQ